MLMMVRDVHVCVECGMGNGESGAVRLHVGMTDSLVQ